MLFEDELHRDAYHKTASTHAQALVQIFEGKAWQYGLQVQLVDVIKPYTILVALGHEASEQVLDELVDSMNEQFKRRDKQYTAQIMDRSIGAVMIFGITATELRHLN